MSHTAAPATLLRMTGIFKSFPGVRALDSVDFEVGESEIHAFIGENGAGKSTLLKILSGALAPDGGTIHFGGKDVVFASPKDAQASGIVTIYQEFSLAPDMTVAENVFIGREPGSKLFVSRGRLEEQALALARRIGLERSPRALVRDLSVAEQQLVEIARALSMKSRLIVMDEPTSALSRTEVEKLFAIIRSLKRDGIATIFVTHRLEEVFEICDRYTVLRDGKQVGHGAVAQASLDGIIRLMESNVNDPVNIGNPHEMTIEEIARTIIKLTGSKSKIVYRPLPADDPKVRQPDITRARTLLGWEPKVGLEEGLTRTLEYFRTKV